MPVCAICDWDSTDRLDNRPCGGQCSAFKRGIDFEARRHRKRCGVCGCTRGVCDATGHCGYCTRETAARDAIVQRGRQAVAHMASPENRHGDAYTVPVQS